MFRSVLKNLSVLCLTVFYTSFITGQTSFSDVSSSIDFEHFSVIYEGDGLAGSAWLDYDLDGDMDLYITNGRTQPNALFRNDGSGNFVDVAIPAGVVGGNGHTGVIVADIDNDRYPDMFLSGDGGMMGISGDSPVTLYHNNGDGTFTDITAFSGVVGGISTLSASFGDIDNDGYVDLFITACGSLRNGQQHENAMYLNNGDLTFTDISESSGVNTALGACVSYFSDYNDDGFIDLFVGNCNETTLLLPSPVELFRNNGDNTFTDVHAAAGLGDGLWMGFAPGDFDNDGDIDLFVTNVGSSYSNPFNSSHAMYENNGDGTYTDIRFDLQLDTLPWGWGAVMADFDNDGWEDIFFAGTMPLPPFKVGCGLPEDSVRPGNPGIFLMNNADGTFEYEVESMTPTKMNCFYTTGVATGDMNNDGFPDLLTAIEQTSDYSGNPFLFENDGNSNHYICLKLEGTDQINRMAIGARVNVVSGSLDMTKEIYSGSSFLSNNSPWLTFGLGANTTVDAISVRWPDGTSESFAPLAVDQCHNLNEGGFVGIPNLAGEAVANIRIAPNPVTENAFFTVDIPTGQGKGVIVITNTTGIVVKTIELEGLAAGTHNIAFEPNNHTGNRMTPGMYMSTLEGYGQPVSAGFLVTY